MAFIRTLTNYEGEEIYPQSTAEAIQRQDGSKSVEASFHEIESNLNTFATMAHVNTAIDNLLGNGAASNLQTLQDLATALGDNANFANTILEELGRKQNKLLNTQCGESLLCVNGINQNDNSIPTAYQVKTYTDSGLNGKIGSINIDGTTYTGTSVTLNLNAYLKTTDAGSAADPMPINADTLNGKDYNDLFNELSCIAEENSTNTELPIVSWDSEEETYYFSDLITMNPSNGYIKAEKVFNAVYNDYAEWFEKDDFNEIFEPGDVCVWTGNGVTKSSSENDKAVIGVVSNSYGHILGGEKINNMENNNKKFVPIGLKGRVKVKIIGDVEIGDLIVSSTNGFAKVNNNAKPNMIIGKSLEQSYDKNEKMISILI